MHTEYIYFEFHSGLNIEIYLSMVLNLKSKINNFKELKNTEGAFLDFFSIKSVQSVMEGVR